MESLCVEQLQDSGLQIPILNILANNKNLSHLLVSGCSNVFQSLLFHPALRKLRTVQMENIEIGMTAIKTLAEAIRKNIFQKIILKNVALRVEVANVEEYKKLLAENLNTAWNNLHLDNVFFGSHASLYDRHSVTTGDIRAHRFLSKSSPVAPSLASPCLSLLTLV